MLTQETGLLTIIGPVYNEESNIRELLTNLQTVMRRE